MKKSLVTRDYPLGVIIEGLHVFWKPMRASAVTAWGKTIGDSVNGPREQFDARYISMARCCLLGMKMSPKKWPMTQEIRQKRLDEFHLADLCNAELKKEVPLQEEIQLFCDSRLGMQVWIGGVAMVSAEPVTLVYRMVETLPVVEPLPAKPLRADVVTTFCAAHLRGHGSGTLIYGCRDGELIRLRSFKVSRDAETFAAVQCKLHHLQRRWQVGQAPLCAHER